MITIKKILVTFSILLVTSCSFDMDNESNLDSDQELSLKTLKNLDKSQLRRVKSEKDDSSVRNVALYETALSVGMRSGLYSRSKEINNHLLQNGDDLEKIFDFRGLMLPNNIMPPVLIESRKTMDARNDGPLPNNDDAFLLNDNPVGKALATTKVNVERSQNNFRTLRITDRIYKIIRQARFAVTVPHWRDYLRLDYAAPGLPDETILPKNQDEQVVWAKGIEEGWNMGLQQADQIFQQNLMLLRRDYLGMVRYRTLLSMKMVSEPYVAKRNYGVTGDGDEIKIHDRVLTIAALPALKPNSKSWTPYLSQDQEQELDTRLTALNLDRMLKYLPGDKAGEGVDTKELYKK